MTKEDLKNTKIYLSNEDDRRKFQEHCFKLGIDWSYLGCEPQTPKRLDSPFFAIKEGRLATFEHSNQFISSSYKQIFLGDVLSIPTDLVMAPTKQEVWAVVNKHTCGKLRNLMLSGVFKHKADAEGYTKELMDRDSGSKEKHLYFVQKIEWEE